MYQIYDIWPKLAKDAYSNEYNISNFDTINHIVFAGMGGSGALGDIFSSILSNTSIHVNVVKGFTLPKTVGKNTLVVATSISGNTIETLNVLKTAKKIGCKIISFGSGGKMEKFCNKNKFPRYS